MAVHDLDAVTRELRDRLGLREPYADPGVAHFGLRNAVFALGDTFLEVVSPVRPDAAAARLIERRGGDCGYMLMFQVADLADCRARVQRLGIREVFEVSVEDMAEVHLHPSDVGGAIVSLSQPQPPESWRWGGPDWGSRSAPTRLAGARLEVPDPESTSARWQTLLGEDPRWLGVTFQEGARGLTEIVLDGCSDAFELAGVRFTPSDYEEE